MQDETQTQQPEMDDAWRALTVHAFNITKSLMVNGAILVSGERAERGDALPEVSGYIASAHMAVRGAREAFASLAFSLGSSGVSLPQWYRDRLDALRAAEEAWDQADSAAIAETSRALFAEMEANRVRFKL